MFPFELYCLSVKNYFKLEKPRITQKVLTADTSHWLELITVILSVLKISRYLLIFFSIYLKVCKKIIVQRSYPRRIARFLDLAIFLKFSFLPTLTGLQPIRNKELFHETVKYESRMHQRRRRRTWKAKPNYQLGKVIVSTPTFKASLATCLHKVQLDFD